MEFPFSPNCHAVFNANVCRQSLCVVVVVCVCVCVRVCVCVCVSGRERERGMKGRGRGVEGKSIVVCAFGGVGGCLDVLGEWWCEWDGGCVS